MKPKRGQKWTRRRTGDVVIVLAIVNPMGKVVAPYVIVDTGKRLSTIRLDRFTRGYTQ